MTYGFGLDEERSLRLRIAEYLKALTALLILLWLFKGAAEA